MCIRSWETLVIESNQDIQGLLHLMAEKSRPLAIAI